MKLLFSNAQEDVPIPTREQNITAVNNNVLLAFHVLMRKHGRAKNPGPRNIFPLLVARSLNDGNKIPVPRGIFHHAPVVRREPNAQCAMLKSACCQGKSEFFRARFGSMGSFLHS